MKTCDYLILGAGIAGSSVGYELADSGKVIVLERESAPGYHTTGRSAAFYTRAYGNRIIRGITAASADFFNHPPAGFTQTPLLTPCGALFIGREEQRATLDELYETTKEFSDEMTPVDGETISRMVPPLKTGDEGVVAGVRDPDARRIDVDALLQGYLRGMTARGGEIVTDAQDSSISRKGDRWQVVTKDETFEAPVLIDAAGAWGDGVAESAGLDPLGLTPLRRTIVLFDPPEGEDVSTWPLVVDADEDFYFLPEAGALMASPADETPSPPCDCQPEDIDVATVAYRVEQATTMAIPRVTHKWAGLRTFSPDRTPVVGFDPTAEGFFWLVGQGGYGIQTAPTMARIAAALARSEGIPEDVAALGISAADLSPARFR